MQDSVSVNALVKSHVLSGVKSSTQALLQVSTGEAPECDVANMRLEVACVLDKSGSMSGDKLLFAKRAVRKLVKHLQPGRDRFHLVVYDTGVHTVFEDGDLSDKELLVDQIRAIRTGSCTNLHGGMAQAADILRRPHDTDNTNTNTNTVKRMFLFSDGLVNQGVTDRSVILSSVDTYVQQGITISAFGIGRDFDESLMRSIASRGKGEYCFLESAQAIPGLVSKSVHHLLQLAGTEARLYVTGLGNTIVTTIHGQDDDDDEITDTNNNNNNALLEGAPLGDLHYSNTRQILVDLETKHPATQCEEEHCPLFSYTLEFKRSGSDEVVRLCGQVGAALTADRSVAVASKDPDAVVAAGAIQRAAALERDVAKLLRERRREAAVGLKSTALDILCSAFAQLCPHDPEGQYLAFTNVQNPELTDDARRVARVRQRTERAKAKLEGDNDIELCLKETAYEASLMRKMSDCGFDSGNDSDSGNWSDYDGPGMHTDDDTDDDDDVDPCLLSGSDSD